MVTLVDTAGLPTAQRRPDTVSGLLEAAMASRVRFPDDAPAKARLDGWDLGGVSTALHPDTGAATIVVYDGHPGGAGFAERGYAVLRDWLQATRATVASCECESGCPSCVQSPKCGNGNDPLDKAGAVRVLDVVLDELASAPELSPEEAEVTRRPAPQSTGPKRRAVAVDDGTEETAPPPDPDDLVF